MKDTNLKGYVLKSKIGSGGMAEVWLAQNTIGKQVAIKIMHQKFIDEAQVVQRFKNEAKATAKLDHPNIRQVIDFGVHENRPYIIQEYLEGKVLSECKGALDELTLQLIWTKSLEGLEYAHSKGIIHRDIKPSNLFLTIHNQLKIVDFGIAKVKDEISITGTGQALGSVLYMSPEQIKDPKRVTTSTDIYSLGITMLHLINGKQPFDASTSAFALQQNIVSGNYSTDDIPAKWVSVVIPCLNKEPENRPTISALLGNFNTKENRVLKKEEETIINGTNNSNNQSKKQKVTKNIAVENLSWFGYYIKGFKNYFNFKGRARRKEFWFFYLFYVVIPIKYDDAWDFSEGLAKVVLNGKYGFIDKTDKVVIPIKYDDAWDFSEGLAKVVLNGKYGFIDKTDKVVIPIKYDSAWSFSEGLAKVKRNNKWGFIDKSGKVVIPIKYDGAWYSFSEGFAEVQLNGKTFFINKYGKCVFDCPE